MAGQAAEESVARFYEAAGGKILQQRWRGQAGEIDLIVSADDEIVFVEVKKSRDFARAAAALRPAQMARLRGAGEEYLGRLPNGLLTNARFDVALVDVHGAVKILENALMEA